MIQYETDLPPEQNKAWMSPSHGSSPSFVGVVGVYTNDYEEKYITALWDEGRVIYTASEILDMKRHRSRKKGIRHLCGWILNTLAWRKRGELYTCYTDEGDELTVKPRGENNEALYRGIIESSAEILAENVTGAALLAQQGGTKWEKI
jgi:hypothetical protein